MLRQSTPFAVATVGIDIGKNTLHLVGLHQHGAIVGPYKLAHHDICLRRGIWSLSGQ
jgi:hypothetical protein